MFSCFLRMTEGRLWDKCRYVSSWGLAIAIKLLTLCYACQITVARSAAHVTVMNKVPVLSNDWPRFQRRLLESAEPLICAHSTPCSKCACSQVSSDFPHYGFPVKDKLLPLLENFGMLKFQRSVTLNLPAIFTMGSSNARWANVMSEHGLLDRYPRPVFVNHILLV